MIERVFSAPTQSPRHSGRSIRRHLKQTAPVLTQINLAQPPAYTIFAKYFVAKVPAFPAKRTTTAYFTHDERLESEIGNGLFDQPEFQIRHRGGSADRNPRPRTTGPARLARPQAAGRQDRHARQRFRRLGCRPGGTGPPAQNPLRRGRGSQGRRNHHPGRPPRPGGRNPRQSGLQMQKAGG